mmetsp:Transcript_2622/g.7698  ORF Transcript_2622/g.7698 Transcript_2622/m.7698 type:complete len:209 (-) Transcript_2622:2056-2682(-)
MDAMVCSPFFLSCLAFARSARELVVEALPALLEPIFTTIEADGTSLSSRSVLFMVLVSDDLTMSLRAVQVIWTSSPAGVPPGNLSINSDKVSAARIARSCTFFLPSIRSRMVQASGSTCSSSSSSSESYSSSNSVSAARRALSNSSLFNRAALAISYLFLSIHLSMQSLATSNGATFTAFFPLPMTRISPSPSSVPKPTLLRMAKADG